MNYFTDGHSVLCVIYLSAHCV